MTKTAARVVNEKIARNFRDDMGDAVLAALCGCFVSAKTAERIAAVTLGDEAIAAESSRGNFATAFRAVADALESGADDEARRAYARVLDFGLRKLAEAAR